MAQQHLTDTRFEELDLPQPLLAALQEAGFTHCTPIQAEALPLALMGKDVAGQAQTGTGKTAAFALAILKQLLEHPRPEGSDPRQPRAYVLAPTRELAIQIHNDIVQLASHTDLRIAVAYGGAGYEQQREKIAAGTDILIGTPGRLIDYFKQRVYSLKQIEVVVLDEADRMFDLGFIKDIRYLLRRMPPSEQRLNMLFSATLSYRVMELAYEHMNNPTMVQVEPERVTADRVRQVVYYTANEEKIPLLLGLLRTLQPPRSIVFVNTKRAADRVWGYLEGNGFKAATLSGDVPQKKRIALLRKFQEGELPILVATDVAARGLHIPEVSHVFNYDLPQDAEDYVHRIGRTARAGASGDAISFACEDYAYSLPEIEAYIGQKIPSQPVDPELLVEPRPPVRPKRSRRPGGDRRGGHRSAGGGTGGGRRGGARAGGRRGGGGGRRG